MRTSRVVLWSVLLIALCVLPAIAPGAQADRTTGTWTGAVELRGNYYWERSTRVTAPSFHGELVSPDGLRLNVDYLVDAITSASTATGLQVDRAFTEVRHDVGLGAQYEFDLGDVQLLTGVRVRYSNEPDYKAYNAGLNAQLAWNERATTLGLSLSFNNDDVAAIQRGLDGTGQPTAMARECSAPARPSPVPPFESIRDCSMRVYFASLNFTQTLSPTTYVELGYDFGAIEGFQANTYRQVLVGGVASPEAHPEDRFRHAVYGRLATTFPETGTSVHLLYRTYVDSWNIAAINPEVRVYQELWDVATLRLRYRFYEQTRAYFAKSASDYTAGDLYLTADPKMTAFLNHQMGLAVTVPLHFLEGSDFDAIREGQFDLSFDYLVNTNRFGNGVIAQASLRLPF